MFKIRSLFSIKRTRNSTTENNNIVKVLFGSLNVQINWLNKSHPNKKFAFCKLLAKIKFTKNLKI